MGQKSLLDQDLQIRASTTYDDAIASAQTVGVAEGQTNLLGDLNVMRTLLKLQMGVTNWYDAPDQTLADIYGRFFINLLQQSGFIDVASGTGGSTNAFDTAIKTITNHNSGGGNSTTEGVVVDTTKVHRLSIRNHDTQDAIDDGSGNEVYGRLSWSGTEYIITWYSMVSGTETAYSFTSSVDIDLACVLVSREYQDLEWDRFIDPSFHDMAGFTGSISDDNVVVDGMLYLYNGLTTQAQVNAQGDKLGHGDTAAEGAHLVKINDSATGGGSNGYFTGDDVQDAFTELKTQIGGTTSTTYNFTENNVLTDNDYIYPALEKLDLKWGDLASVATGEGASLVGVEDTGGYFTGTDVEAVLQEIGQELDDQGVQKYQHTETSVITGGTPWTLPGSLQYTPDSGGHAQNMDVYLEGQLQHGGILTDTTTDYQEAATGALRTQITWNKTIPANRNFTFMVRK